MLDSLNDHCIKQKLRHMAFTWHLLYYLTIFDDVMVMTHLLDIVKKVAKNLKFPYLLVSTQLITLLLTEGQLILG